MQPGNDKRVGVIWHTHGSGKSLSMIFLAGILRRWPGLNPTIVVQVDRTDLDNQLYDKFVAAKDAGRHVHQADSVDDLRELLQTEGGEVIFSTIEKFRSSGSKASCAIRSCPRAHNMLVIADEAHRTQYNLLDGFGYHLRQALPNASFIGFTGTPIDKEDANTVQLFGEAIHIYDMQQAKDDNAVVGIYYEPRHIPLRPEEPEDRRRPGGDRRGAGSRHLPRTSWSGPRPMGGDRAGRRHRGPGGRSWPGPACALSQAPKGTPGQGDGRLHEPPQLRRAVRRADGLARLPGGQDRDDRQPD